MKLYPKRAVAISMLLGAAANGFRPREAQLSDEVNTYIVTVGRTQRMALLLWGDSRTDLLTNQIRQG
jgi:hypothetical protein